MIETKGLSCLFFLEIQPLEKTVAYKVLLIKQNKCSDLQVVFVQVFEAFEFKVCSTYGV